MSASGDRIPLEYRRIPMSVCLYHNVGHEKRMQLRSQRLLLEREALMRRAIVNSSLKRSEQGPPFKYKNNDEYFDMISGSASDEFNHLRFRTVVRHEGKICHSFILRLHNNDGHEEEEEELVNEKQEVTEEHREKKDEELKAVICMQEGEGEEEDKSDMDYENGECETLEVVECSGEEEEKGGMGKMNVRSKLSCTRRKKVKSKMKKEHKAVLRKRKLEQIAAQFQQTELLSRRRNRKNLPLGDSTAR